MSVLRLASARLVAESAACKRASLATLAIDTGAAGGRSVSEARGFEPLGSLVSSDG